MKVQVQEYEVNLCPPDGAALGDPLINDKEVVGVLTMILSNGGPVRGRFMLFTATMVDMALLKRGEPKVIRDSVPDAEVKETVASLRRSHEILDRLLKKATTNFLRRN